MAYTKTQWVNNGEPPIDATNLNNIEDGIFDNDALITKVLSAIGIATTTWSSSGTYAIDDIVVYNNKLYINLTGTNTATTPDSDSTNWAETSILV